MIPFDQITVQFFNATSGWKIIGIDIAKEIFVVLALIQLIWSGLLWLLNKNNPDEVLVDFIRKMLFLSLFWQIIINYDHWIPAIIDSLRAVGSRMSGTSIIYPGDVFKKGIELSSSIFNNSESRGFLKGIFGSIVAAFVAFITFLVFTRIAIEMILIIIGSRIILFGGIIMLGFAGNQWTQKYAERYFATAINFGIKMLFITLIIGLGESLSDGWITIIATAEYGGLLEAYFSVLGAVLVYGYLAIRIPEMAANMLTGEALSIGFPGAVRQGMQAARDAWSVASIPNKVHDHITKSNKESSEATSKIKPMPGGFETATAPKGDKK